MLETVSMLEACIEPILNSFILVSSLSYKLNIFHHVYHVIL